MSVNTKMTAIADEIRELSGTSNTMGLDAMATNLGDANNEVSNQADLITQIARALEGKASGDGEIELPELINPAFQEEVFLDKEFIDKDGKVKTGTFTIENELTEQESLIAQIQSVVDSLPEAGGSGSGISEFSTVTLRLADVNLSDYYSSLWGYDETSLSGSYINEAYEHIFNSEFFSNGGTNATMNKSEITITVFTNSTIILNFSRLANHYISVINSSVHNELYDMTSYEQKNHPAFKVTGGNVTTSSGERYCNIPIFGNTEIIIKEYD